MNSAKDFKRIAEEALNKKRIDGEDHPIHIPIGKDNFSITLEDPKIEIRKESQTFFAYDKKDIIRKKEIWLNQHGICVRELVYGRRNNGTFSEEIKSNFFPSFTLTWENGDYVQVVNGEITKFKISK